MRIPFSGAVFIASTFRASRFAIFAFTVISAAFAGEPPALRVAATATEQPPPATNPGVNRVTQAAVLAGILSCTTRINQVSNFVTAGSQQSGGYLFPTGSQPDRTLVSASMEVQHANAPPAYISASFAPNQANGCGAVYESVAWWNNRCEAVATTQFAGLLKAGVLGKSTLVLDGGPVMKVFLMPAGDGCVSVKKELVQ